MIAITACTYSITLIHTDGQTSDVMDQVHTPTSTVEASLPIPQL